MRLAPVLHLDPHAQQGGYFIRSLYFDDYWNTAYEEKDAGVLLRKKYHSHSSVIIRAYDNSYINPEKKEKDVFAINVLKTLFLIKYVLEIEANVDNIVSLMITSIDDDRISLKAQMVFEEVTKG